MGLTRALIAVAAAAAVLATTAVGGASPTLAGKLAARVDASGAVVLTSSSSIDRPSRIRPGWYLIAVRDRSRTQNFHLVGPRGMPSRRTTLEFAGATKWKINLRPGLYAYRSDARPRAEKHFRVN